MLKTEANARESYKLYKKLSTEPTTSKIYLDIGAGYRAFLLEKVIDGEEVTLPYKVGTLSIKGIKKILKFDKNGVPLLPPDWKATINLWNINPEAKATKKIVFCTNEHTSGVVYKFMWSKNRVPIKNKTLYSLRLTKSHKIAVSKKILEGKEYLIVNK